METPGYGSGGYTPPPASSSGPSGTVLIIMGVAGILCCGILAPITWVLSNNAMTALDSGQGNESERGNINAARILGIIGSVLLVLQVIWALTVGVASFRMASQMPRPGTPPTFQNVPAAPAAPQ